MVYLARVHGVVRVPLPVRPALPEENCITKLIEFKTVNN